MTDKQLGGLFSSATDEWATPQEFFDELNGEFHFTLDPAANEANHKCETFFTKEQNGLACPWGGTRRSAIHRMGVRLESGYRKRGRSMKRTATRLLCFFRLGRTPNGSTNTSMAKPRSALCEGG